MSIGCAQEPGRLAAGSTAQRTVTKSKDEEQDAQARDVQGDEGIGSPKERQLEAGNTGCGGENQSGLVIQNANYMRSTVPYDRLSQEKGDKDDTATAMLRLNHHRDYRELNLLQYRQEAGKFRQRDLYGRVFFICYSRFISAVLSHKFTLNLLQPAFKLLIRQRKGRKLPLD